LEFIAPAKKHSTPHKIAQYKRYQATTQDNLVSKYVRSLLYGVVEVKWCERMRSILRNRAAAFLLADRSPSSNCVGARLRHAFVNEHDSMEKNLHLRAVDDLHDTANIYFSVPTSSYASGNLQTFSSSHKFITRGFPKISSPDHFYLTLPLNVTSSFFQRLIKYWLFARN
jgi:hypothetical protein